MRTNILQLAWRHAWRRLLQSLFFIVGIAIGVAAVVAIDLANSSVSRAFSYSTESIVGKTTHRIVGGSTGIDQKIYVDLRRKLGYQLCTPIISAYVTSKQLDQQPIQLLGIDIFSSLAFNTDSSNGLNSVDPVQLSRFMVQPNSAIISIQFASRHQLQINATVDVNFHGRSRRVTICQIIDGGDGNSSVDNILLVDISTAQEISGKISRLDRIDLIIPENSGRQKIQSAIESMLPMGVRLEANREKSGATRQMLSAFQLNLTALSLLALVVGVFLIYNTVTFSVVQRRPTIAILRAIGMTRREIFTLVLTEGIILGIIGTGVGLLVGTLLGQATVDAVVGTINDIFFVTSVRQVSTAPIVYLKSILIGLSASIISAIAPAYEATNVPPLTALRRSDTEEKVNRILPWVSLIGLLTLVFGFLLLIPNWHLVIAFGGVFAVLIGFALLSPLMTLILMKIISPILKGSLGLIGSMAARDIMRSLSRTSVAITALMVAVSVIIGVGLMTSSFRRTVQRWLFDLLQADIFISGPRVAGSATTSLAPKVVEVISEIPSIERILTNREVQVTSVEVGSLQLVAVSEDIAGERRQYKSAKGSIRQTWQAVESGGIVINEPMAVRFKLEVGDRVKIFTDKGLEPFEIAAVAYNFDVRPVVTMHQTTYQKFWHDRVLSSAALTLKPGEQIDEVIQQLRQRLSGKIQVIIQSNRELRQNAMEIFDKTFAVTRALQVIAMAVAFIGVLSTLMSLQLERRREIGLLRAVGIDSKQLWQLILLETSLMGTTAGMIALPVGIVLATILIYIINLRSFGWTLQMHIQSTEFLKAFVISISSALMAGIYPAWQLGRIPAVDALRNE